MKSEIPAFYFEPLLSEETMYFHYQLYQNYWNRLKDLVKDDKAIDAVTHIENYPLEKRGNILHNAGGVLNHELYFGQINIHGDHQPSGNLKKAIETQYGTFENWKQELLKVSKLLVGSGYTFLVVNDKKQLDIVNMSNQESPYFYGMIPIMNIDLWEHAYYLDYKISKEQYLNSFFDLIDFDVIETRYDQAITKNL